jgi:hypothetical protein
MVTGRQPGSGTPSRDAFRDAMMPDQTGEKSRPSQAMTIGSQAAGCEAAATVGGEEPTGGGGGGGGG